MGIISQSGGNKVRDNYFSSSNSDLDEIDDDGEEDEGDSSGQNVIVNNNDTKCLLAPSSQVIVYKSSSSGLDDTTLSLESCGEPATDKYQILEDVDDNDKLPLVLLVKDSSICARCRRLATSYRGYFYALLYALCMSLVAIFIKKSVLLAGSEQSIIRYVIQLLFMGAIIKYKRLGWFGPKRERMWIVARGFIGSTSVVLKFFSIKYIHPSDVSTLTNLNIITTAILARLFLNEKLTLMHIVATVLSFVGVALIFRPTFLFSSTTWLMNNATNSSASGDEEFSQYSNTTLGVTLVLLSAITIGANYVVIKRLCLSKVHFATISFLPCFVGIFEGTSLTVLLYSFGELHTDFVGSQAQYDALPWHIFWAVCGGFCGTVALAFLNFALDQEDATKVSILKVTEVFFTFLLQFLVLNIKVDAMGALGSAFIIVSIFGLMFFKLLEKKASTSQNNSSLWNFAQCFLYKF